MKYTPESICTSPRMDRFIPQRHDLNLAQLKLIHDESHKDTAYNRLLQQSLFSCKLKNHKIFSFGEKPKRRDSRKISREKQSVEYRKVDQLPRYVLDAPGIEDDFYLNILDWSCHNLLCVALQHEVYIRDMQEGDTFKFMETDDTLITCINFSLDGSYLAIATDNCDVQIWDVETERLVRTLRGYLGRVESISWNNEILSVGCRNGCIVNHDVRMANHYISTFKGHRDHVSGLKWNSFGTQLVSGGNDNLLQIWSLHRKEPKLTFRKHRAAIKAVAWCPWKPALLASGGGAEDACIHIWDTETGKCIKSVHSHSQVSAIIWSKNSKEFVSAHGYRNNNLKVWIYPSMHNFTSLSGHKNRILHMAQSNDGCLIASLAADEELRIWKVFERSKHNEERVQLLSVDSPHVTIR